MELELTVVGNQRRLTRERNVDLLLVRIERVGAVLVVRIAVPVGRQGEDLHAPSCHTELGASPARQAAVHRLHLVDRLDRHVRHRAPHWSEKTVS